MPAPTDYLLVALGSAVGGAARCGLDHAVRLWLGARFPWGILVVNVLGCLLIGLLMPTLRDERLRWLIATGALGGFTTFSAFSWQTVELWSHDRPLAAGAYVLASVALCLTACWLGWRLAR